MIKLSSKTENIAVVENLLHDVFNAYCINEEHLPAILISLTEAVNNAIVHGNLLDDSKNVFITHSFTKGVLRFNVTDEGKGFDQEKIADPTCKENLEKCGGRGVFIMKELSHDLKYLNNGREIQLCFRVGTPLKLSVGC